MVNDLALARLLQQDRITIGAGAAAITLLSWTYLFYLDWAMHHMDLVSMAMPGTGPWATMDLLLVFAMWAVMMVGSDTKLLEEMVFKHRVEILEEWEAKVRVQCRPNPKPSA